MLILSVIPQTIVQIVLKQPQTSLEIDWECEHDQVHSIRKAECLQGIVHFTCHSPSVNRKCLLLCVPLSSTAIVLPINSCLSYLLLYKISIFELSEEVF